MRGAGRGAFGCRRGFGRGLGYVADYAVEDPKESLTQRKQFLERQLDQIARRLEEWKEE
jgi:hypothetical protein